MRLSTIHGKKITVWSIIKDGKKIHNHIEDGWSDCLVPRPIDKSFTNQQAWRKMDWQGEHAYLTANNTVYRLDTLRMS